MVLGPCFWHLQSHLKTYISHRSFASLFEDSMSGYHLIKGDTGTPMKETSLLAREAEAAALMRTCFIWDTLRRFLDLMWNTAQRPWRWRPWVMGRIRKRRNEVSTENLSTAQCWSGTQVSSVDLGAKDFQQETHTNKQAITTTIWCKVCYDR